MLHSKQFQALKFKSLKIIKNTAHYRQLVPSKQDVQLVAQLTQLLVVAL